MRFHPGDPDSDPKGYDEPTQQLPRPPISAPLPGPLDQTRGLREPAASEPYPDADADADSTGVLSLDDLLGPPETAEADPSEDVTVSGSTGVPERPGRAPMPVVPIRSAAAGTDQAARVRADAAAALRGGADGVLRWLRRDDNTLTLATALVAIMLLSIVAAFGS